jgi:hypothetical protein
MNKSFFFILGFFLVATYIGQVRFFEETYTPGDELTILANVRNYQAHSVDNVNVQVLIPELGYYSQTGSFKVHSMDTYGKILDDYLPDDAPTGDYMVRVSVANDDFRESTWRYITIE